MKLMETVEILVQLLNIFRLIIISYIAMHIPYIRGNRVLLISQVCVKNFELAFPGFICLSK